MQAIETKYLSPTNTKGSRIKATCDRGSKMFSWNHSLNEKDNHEEACLKLREYFAKQDQSEYGNPFDKNHWLDDMAMGQLSNGNYVHVFLEKQLA